MRQNSRTQYGVTPANNFTLQRNHQYDHGGTFPRQASGDIRDAQYRETLNKRERDYNVDPNVYNNRIGSGRKHYQQKYY